MSDGILINEEQALLKLFATDHLNVPERTILPNGKVRASLARELIEKHLCLYGWFPATEQYPTGDQGGAYYQLELDKNESLSLHSNVEYAYLRYKHSKKRFSSIPQLITAYLRVKEDEGLDGLSIDWDR
ncbi:hypothetical protein [Mariprofundus ferrooxydans]|uniref:hypothetical protein n=1 Tax=Mariprofundus ferrooxydans TaxID=314344 RepID=UPI001431D061|nr:hypothetical protein [Mariprofundus ferrooxydans]